MVASVGVGTALILVSGFLGIAFAAFQMWMVASTDMTAKGGSRGSGASKEEESGNAKLIDGTEKAQVDPMPEMMKINGLIIDGAKAFLFAEYALCLIFVVVFGILVCVATAHKNDNEIEVSDDASGSFVWKYGGLTALSFVIGAITSMASGYLGMMVAVYSNVRTTKCAMETGEKGWVNAFNCAFRAGGVMGFSCCGVAVLVLFVTIKICEAAYSDVDSSDAKLKAIAYKELFECVAGFGLGGSSIAMFGRVGGGIYTKAADVGADLAGKVCHGLPEDDPRNPAVIADNVGDNVGDVAGMGSDLFGSFGEATCAALVIASQSPQMVDAGMAAVLFPLYISAAGICVCILTSFFATDLFTVKNEAAVERALKVQLAVSSILMTAVLYPLCAGFLPSSAEFECDSKNVLSCDLKVDNMHSKAFLCVCLGLWGGCLIGFITEYYTSSSYGPVRAVAKSTETGAATNIIYGLALGYQSAILPASIIAVVVYISFTNMGMFGISLAALGMLSTLATCLSIDIFGPVCDNAGGIAEMAGCPANTRKKTDSLDAAGNTTAAIGKGFAIGSACLVSLAMFGAFTTRVGWLEKKGVNVLRPITFAFLIIGAMLPYWFTAMTMKSVGEAANAMVKEVKRQFDANPDLMDKSKDVSPDYTKCIAISTNASLREMIPPALLVLTSPILTGVFFGVEAVCGLLSGAIVSGVQMAISQSNTGGAWDNAKKYVGSGQLTLIKNGVPVVIEKEVDGVCTEEYAAAVVGDTVGDPLKDTSGPALNILMKLMAIISLVFSGFFMSINEGRGVFDISSWNQKMPTIPSN